MGLSRAKVRGPSLGVHPGGSKENQEGPRLWLVTWKLSHHSIQTQSPLTDPTCGHGPAQATQEEGLQFFKNTVVILSLPERKSDKEGQDTIGPESTLHGDAFLIPSPTAEASAWPPCCQVAPIASLC